MNADSRWDDVTPQVWKVSSIIEAEESWPPREPFYCPNCIVWFATRGQARKHLRADIAEAAEASS